MTAIDTWMLDVAERLKELRHTETDKRYARNLDEYKLGARAKFDYKRLILVRDEAAGKIEAQGDNRWDAEKVGFWLLKQCRKEDWAEEQAILEEAKTVMYKILSKCELERETGSGTMKYYEPDSTNWRKVGPDIDNCFGVHCSFSLVEGVNAEMEYDEADWD